MVHIECKNKYGTGVPWQRRNLSKTDWQQALRASGLNIGTHRLRSFDWFCLLFGSNFIGCHRKRRKMMNDSLDTINHTRTQQTTVRRSKCLFLIFLLLVDDGNEYGMSVGDSNLINSLFFFAVSTSVPLFYRILCCSLSLYKCAIKCFILENVSVCLCMGLGKWNQSALLQTGRVECVLDVGWIFKLIPLHAGNSSSTANKLETQKRMKWEWDENEKYVK